MFLFGLISSEWSFDISLSLQVKACIWVIVDLLSWWKPQCIHFVHLKLLHPATLTWWVHPLGPSLPSLVPRLTPPIMNFSKWSLGHVHIGH